MDATSSVDDTYQTMTTSPDCCMSHINPATFIFMASTSLSYLRNSKALNDRHIMKDGDHWEMNWVIFLANSNHKSLRVETEHPLVYKVVIKPKG